MGYYCDPRYVETNRGLMPLVDYLEIVSCQNGFDSYKKLRKAGLHIRPGIIIIDESKKGEEKWAQ